jgi:hypothetical protein
MADSEQVHNWRVCARKKQQSTKKFPGAVFDMWWAVFDMWWAVFDMWWAVFDMWWL